MIDVKFKTAVMAPSKGEFGEILKKPFVGGANMIDKIKHHNKIGCDIHKELIALLQYAQENELPDTITVQEYTAVKNNKTNYIRACF